MGVRGGKKLPASVSSATRYVFGILTFFLWYLAMLSAMGILALLTVRKFQDVGYTVLGLLLATAVAWGLRRLVLSAWVPGGPHLAATGHRQ